MKTNNLTELKLQQQQRKAAKTNNSSDNSIIEAQRETLHLASKASRFIERHNY